MNSKRDSVMSHRMVRIGWAIGFLASVLWAAPAVALITGGTTEPMKDYNWPAGSVELANQKSRVAWWEGPPLGGGEYHFEYRGDTAAFEDALRAFAAIDGKELELVVHSGTAESFWLKVRRDPNQNTKIDWTFTVWTPERWHALYNNPSSYFAAGHPNFRKPLAAPRLDVYVGGSIDWTKIDVPKPIKVIDMRASVAGYQTKDDAVLVGRVLDLTSSKAVATAQIMVDRRTQDGAIDVLAESPTDAKGRFQIEHIPAGICRVWVRASGYAPRLVAHEQLEPDSLHRFDVELARATEVSGVAIDKDTGKPVAGVEVRLNNTMAINGRGYASPDTPKVVTLDDGRFTLANVPEGFAQFWCHKQGYHHNPIGKLYRLPSGTVTLELSGTGTVRVTVLDAKRQPITQSYLVMIEPETGAGIGKWNGSSQVRPDGTVTFDGVPQGSYRIRGQPNPGAVNDVASDHIVQIRRGQTNQVELVHR